MFTPTGKDPRTELITFMQGEEKKILASLAQRDWLAELRVATSHYAKKVHFAHKIAFAQQVFTFGWVLYMKLLMSQIVAEEAAPGTRGSRLF